MSSWILLLLLPNYYHPGPPPLAWIPGLLSATIQYSPVHPLLEKFFQRANMILSYAPKSHLHLKTQWLPVALGKKIKIFNMLNTSPHGYPCPPLWSHFQMCFLLLLVLQPHDAFSHAPPTTHSSELFPLSGMSGISGMLHTHTSLSTKYFPLIHHISTHLRSQEASLTL